jgi:hypothetical protein
MKIIRKYEFVDEAAANTAIDLLRDEEGNLTQSVVKLGFIVKTAGTYDEEGNEVTAPVLSEKYAVDVCWDGESHAEWDSAMVFPTPLGVHSFGSSSQRDEYATKYCELFPDSEYCNPPDPEEV